MVASINKWPILQYKTSQKYITCQKRFFRENDENHYGKDKFCQKLCYHNSYFQHSLLEKVGETSRWMIRKDGTWDTKSSVSNFNQNSMIIGKHALQYPMIQIKLKISRLPVEISQYITHGTSYLSYNILKSFLIGMGSPGA